MDKLKRAEEIAVQILKYSRNELLVSLRFMDLALCKLEYRMENLNSVATDGKYLYFNPKHIFLLYETGSSELNHTYMHTVFHCIFYHPFVNKTIDDPVLWDLACDIAVEGIISELNMKQMESMNSPLIAQELANIKSKYGKLTAERLYRKFLSTNIKPSEVMRLQKLFAFDEHFPWYAEEEQKGKSSQTQKNNQKSSQGKNQDELADDNDEDTDADENDQASTQSEDSSSQNSASGGDDKQDNFCGFGNQGEQDDTDAREEWQSISERVKVDIETASKEWGDRSANLLQNITEVNRETYDYSEFLQKFSVMGEEMQINDDEFDYIFYTYGLQLYKNVPLIEPLEYKDVKKIKEFVIAIDTSGSVHGELVKKFITKTYNILSQQTNFFTKINVHIIQCDAEIQKDDKITSKEEFEELMKNIELRGFGGTDFRPVFNYVDTLIRKGEFENLKGLIYFTDGYGTFPEKQPGYDTAFIFIDDEFGQPQIPVWAIKLVLAKDEI